VWKINKYNNSIILFSGYFDSILRKNEVGIISIFEARSGRFAKLKK